MLLNDLCLVKLEHGFEEHEFKLFVAALFLQVLRDQHMVSLEPLIAKFDCLFRVHPYEVANVFGDQLLHGIEGDSGHDSLDSKEDAGLVWTPLLLHLDQPLKHVRLNRFLSKEELQALLEAAKQLIQEYS